MSKAKAKTAEKAADKEVGKTDSDEQKATSATTGKKPAAAEPENPSPKIQSPLPAPPKAAPVAAKADGEVEEAFKRIDPMSDEQLALGSMAVLELSHDAGKTWVKFEAVRFHVHGNAIEADLRRFKPIAAHKDGIFVARIWNGGKKSQRIWKGKLHQYVGKFETSGKPSGLRVRVS